MQRLLLLMFLSLLHINGIAASAEDRIIFDSNEQKLSYALGVSFAPKVAQSLGQQGIKIDPDLFASGLSHALSAKPLALSEEEIEYTLASLQKMLVDKQITKITNQASNFYEQLFTPLGYPERGNPEAEITLVVFFDYQCPHCKDMHPQLLKLLERYPNLKVIYRDLPILGPTSVKAAELAIAAQQSDHYLPLHDVLIASHGPLTTQMLKKAVKDAGLNWQQLDTISQSYATQRILKNNANMAASLGITKTPSYLFTRTIKGKTSATAPVFYLSGKQHILTFERRFEEL